jgi:hypothetical protein
MTANNSRGKVLSTIGCYGRTIWSQRVIESTVEQRSLLSEDKALRRRRSRLNMMFIASDCAGQ